MNRKELMERLQQVEGIRIEKVVENQIYCVDDRMGRDLVYNVLEEMDISELIHWGRFSGDKEAVLKTLSHVPKGLFLSIDKIILLADEEDFEELHELSGSHTFNFKEHVGMFVMHDNMVILNLHLLEKTMSEEERKYMEAYSMEIDEVDTVFNKRNEIEREMWLTLFYELRHGLLMDPIHEDMYDGMTNLEREKDAEKFSEDLLIRLYEESKVSSFLRSTV